MVSIPPIWPFEKIYRYLKRYYDIFIYLKKIGKENSNEYNKHIQFTSISSWSKIKEPNFRSPFLEITFAIKNFCIFNFKINSIDMEIYYNNEQICSINKNINLELPCQSEIDTHLEAELNQKFVDNIKKIGEEHYINFLIKNIKIDFIGDKDFQNFTRRREFAWKADSDFWLKISMHFDDCL